MTEHQIEGNWHVLKGKAKSHWGKLTDDDIERIAGDSERLAGVIQKRYGGTLDDARRQVSEWKSRLQD